MKPYFLLLLMLPSAFAYIPMEHYGNTTIKFYSDDINKDACYNLLYKIPDKYINSIKLIRIYNNTRYSDYVLGRYFWKWNTIALYDGCVMDTLVHELAHHQQYLENQTFSQAITHTGHFEAWEIIIRNEAT